MYAASLLRWTVLLRGSVLPAAFTRAYSRARTLTVMVTGMGTLRLASGIALATWSAMTLTTTSRVSPAPTLTLATMRLMTRPLAACWALAFKPAFGV